MSPPEPQALAANLFGLNPDARPTLELVGGRLPVLIVDQLFSDPEALRSNALTLSYQSPDYPYPGRIAEPALDDPSFQSFLRTVLSLVNEQYLPKIPPIAANNRRIDAFARALTDFAITDVHPEELTETQRRPHTDPVPIFGLVYLNPDERGGTLFFDPPASIPDDPDRRGYCSTDDAHYRFIGKIEGIFNRLAIYPGFVLHTGEISGNWITSDERFKTPRLTQRLVFFP